MQSYIVLYSFLNSTYKMTTTICGNVTATIPLMKHKELRVTASGGTDDLTPSSGRSIIVWGYQGSMLVPSALTSTVRATLAFGTDHTADPDKVFASFRTVAKDTIGCVCIMNIHIKGSIDEIVRLTNITYSVGSCITRAIIYYTEE